MKNQEIKGREYFLKPGYIYLAAEPTMISTVLGSCVAVSLHDKLNHTGCMNHIVHPLLTEDVPATAMYAKPATIHMIRMFKESGSNLDNVEAQVFGGAAHPGATGDLAKTGENNLEIAEQLLMNYGINVVGRDVGGNQGRKVVVNTSNGEVIIAKVNNIRRDDWYPGNQRVTK